jgi:HPt (histidine-containing phosphotransfer) domain-containing protein
MEMQKSLPASTNNAEPIDLSGALRRLRGDNELLLELISFFLEDYPQVAADVHRAARENRGDELALAAHSMKGLAANFDAQQVVDTAGAIEQHAKGGNLTSAAELIPTLDASIERLSADLCDYRDAQSS